jgi:RHS repeat-associated protein
MVEEITGTTTTAYHFHYDGNGNVTEVTDLNGNPAATYRYDAFGNTLISKGNYANTNRYRFSTKPLDSEVTSAPLYYYGYRYYDPVTGRWPSRDPIEEEGGNNLYGFVLNNPLFYIDVLGNQISIPAGVAGAAAAGWSATDIAATFGVSLAIAQAAIQAERCKVLRAAVKAAKQAVGAVAGKCKCTDSPEVIAAKTAAWCALAEARWNQNQECFSGGDPTHVEEQQKAYDKCVECKNTVSNQP